MNNKLSVVLLVRNEEANIGPCLQSVKDIADEIIILDEHSTDKTVEIAKRFGANIYTVNHEDNFHINKQKAIEKASGDWILQLDADERVTKELAAEIKKIVNSPVSELLGRVLGYTERPKGIEGLPQKKVTLLQRHQKLIEEREGRLGKSTGEVVAFFVPRRNVFLGKPLIHAGVYPDGVIRLIKRGKARLPAKSVHELMEVDGEVGWLFNDLEHHDSPTFKRYLDRANRYTDLTAEEFRKQKLSVSYWNLFKYSFPIPTFQFLNLYIRHKGILDGFPGFVWSLFSALHFPMAYFKYWQSTRK